MSNERLTALGHNQAQDETWVPHLTVATIVEDQGKFLMVEEVSKGRQVLNQPAGHVEARESLIEAAMRETLEETAWQVEIINLVGLYQWHLSATNETFFRYTFAARPLTSVNQPLDTGIIAAHWLTTDEINQHHSICRSPLVMRCINDYLQGQQYPLASLIQLYD